MGQNHCGFLVDFNVEPVACYGDSTGSVEVEIIGGTGDYQFFWDTDNVAISESKKSKVEKLPAQTYFLKILDEKGCRSIEFVTIVEPEKLDVVIEPTDVLCHGESTGIIALQAINGQGGYTYWIGEEETELSRENDPNITVLSASTYYIEVKDKKMCSVTAEVIINQPEALTSETDTIHVTCFGESDGEIETFAFGGTPPYTYSWENDDIPENKKVFGLQAGLYNRTITDYNGCPLIEVVEVKEPDEFITTFVTTPEDCNEAQNGTITATTNGGTLPYSRLWSNSKIILGEDAEKTTVIGEHTEQIIGLPADKYKLRIIDKNGCPHSSNTEVTQPQVLVTNINSRPVTCYGGNNGAGYFSVSGGTEPYSYLWSNDEKTPNIQNLTAGKYWVVVDDKNGCTEKSEIEIIQPTEIKIANYVDIVSCRDDHDGAILLDVTGGYPDYTYSWDNGLETDIVTNLDGGLYTVTVTDDSMCTMKSSIQVDINPISCINIPSGFSPNDDEVNDTWIIRNAELYPELSLQVFNRWGNLIYESQGYGNDQLWDGTKDGKNLPADTYYYILDTKEGEDPFTGGITIIR